MIHVTHGRNLQSSTSHSAQVHLSTVKIPQVRTGVSLYTTGSISNRRITHGGKIVLLQRPVTTAHTVLITFSDSSVYGQSLHATQQQFSDIQNRTKRLHAESSMMQDLTTDASDGYVSRTFLQVLLKTSHG